MQIQDLWVVLKVAEFRSITAAATSLNMQAATASAALKRVEQALGAELFVRTTRQLRLSPQGEKFIPQCEHALQLLQQAGQNLKDEQHIIDGELRLALSSDLGRNIILPWLDEFMLQHPKLSIKAHISDTNVDFYRDPVDLALRYGAPRDASLYGFKICHVPRVLCAAPSYLATHGTPTHPHQLASHNGLCYQLYDLVKDVWEFQHQNDTFKVKISGNRVANDADLVRRWCVAGQGVAIKSALDMSAHLLDGTVQRLLPEYQPTPTELWLVCPSRQLITPTVRLLRDMLRTRCTDLLQQLLQQALLHPADLPA
ncbi:LysR family transcriptional regulator [Rheinheimera sp. UJ51]|uniref:LysR family transcriptional regulator n=1 Tax=unclassified Rheinheimera TaxID=115860 RepID=UPI001E4BB161|nr:MULTISPECIES: LysR family transcriptional regulator [unclassified Rheinheimera]MCC5453107.1 LysR family transcriptional regulator [Rheinheimera sp. UJ51]MCF4010426.1 LysR family transcriptional regulator [Rheinheimera sp. UJ63]